ncbi:MAG: head-tail joining protein [Alphaproteobacteria bacterium]
MAFDFDRFINLPCVGGKDKEGNVIEGIFGRSITYIPANSSFDPFSIAGDFHKAYEEVNPEIMGDASISSAQMTIFIREADIPDIYPKPLQGDYLEVTGLRFQIIDVQVAIPGSLKLILHEDSNATS